MFRIFTKPSSIFTAETLRTLLKKKETNKTGFRLSSSADEDAWSLLIRREPSLVLENVCGVAKRGVPGCGSVPSGSSDGWDACQRLLPMSQEQIFATDVFKFQVNIFKIWERLEVVAFFRMLLFQIWNSGLSPFWPHCSPRCCLNMPGRRPLKGLCIAQSELNAPPPAFLTYSLISFKALLKYHLI